MCFSAIGELCELKRQMASTPGNKWNHSQTDISTKFLISKKATMDSQNKNGH